MDAQKIRQQMERILVHPHFRKSHRYPALLRYVVEKALEGEAESLKERTLGMDVFGRAAAYDTNLDHVVRSTAAEVRKRLAQYYQEPEREGEIRIDLPSGSYVPQFRRPPVQLPVKIEERTPVMVVQKPASWRTLRLRSKPKLLGFLAVGTGIAILAFLLAPRGNSEAGRTALDRFWAPVCKSPGSVALCVGDPRKAWTLPSPGGVPNPPLEAFESLGRDRPEPRPPARGASNSAPAVRGTAAALLSPAIRTVIERSVPFSDAVTLTRLGAIFALKKKDYRVVYSPDSTLWDLRQGAAVLVGGVDNFWAVRLTSELRFRFLVDRSADMFTFVIEDRNGGKVWRSSGAPKQNQGLDYALITRVEHPTTGHVVVVAGGIQEYGTLAAGEFLTDGAALAELERLAPKDWKGVNVQAVLSTNVLKGSPAPPKIVAAYFW